jgi:glycosyltransferase involved in cell wall biosynthesis
VIVVDDGSSDRTPAVLARFPDAILEAHNELGELSIVVEASRIVDVCRSLKYDEKFIRLGRNLAHRNNC